mgnify:CR=1 FL=1
MFNYQNEDAKGSRDINNQERQIKQVLILIKGVSTITTIPFLRDYIVL